MTDSERKEIVEELSHYPQARAGCVDALKVIQRHRGWVPDEEIGDVAAMLEMSEAELDAVATFYPFIFRKPVGRHIISVCDSLSCWLMGYEAILQALTQRLDVTWGGTTKDGRFTLLPVACLGQCDQAPAIMIDKEVYGNLRPEMIELILERYA